MRLDWVLLGGTVVTSADSIQADVGIVGGKIVALGDLTHADAANSLDVRGLHVLPGIIDTQVHFREPGMTHKEDIGSGSLAAVCGGVTSFFEMPNTSPTTTDQEALDAKLEIAQRTSRANYSFFVGATTGNSSELAELEMSEGTPGIKIFMGSSTGSLLVDHDGDLLQVLKSGRRRFSVHAEDEARNKSRRSLLSERPHWIEHPHVRDAESAVLATRRIIRLSEQTGRPVHVLHVSTHDELSVLADAKRAGLGTTCEVTPQHLWFAAPDCYEELGSRAQMNPPIRTEEHRAGIRAALKAGLFDVIGSDHAPHTIEEKMQKYPFSPSGMPGVQTLGPVMLTLVRDGLITVNDFVRLACEGPCRIFGIRDKGRVGIGLDADLAIFDLQRSEAVDQSWLRSRCGWSPYEGEVLTGWPIHTWVMGNPAMLDGEPTDTCHGQPVRFDWKGQP